MKVQVYRKVTPTDQYLSFHSRHPLNHTLGVIHTIYTCYWCDNIVMEEAAVAAKIIHVDKALGRCGYPKLLFRRVKEAWIRQSRKEELGRSERRVTGTPRPQ